MSLPDVASFVFCFEGNFVREEGIDFDVLSYCLISHHMTVPSVEAVKNSLLVLLEIHIVW